MKIDLKSKFDMYKRYLEIMLKRKSASGGNGTVIDDGLISECYDAVESDPKNIDFRLTDDEKNLYEREIKAEYSVYQDEGIGLIGDYEHDSEWYDKLLQKDGYNEYYWPRYKEYLRNGGFNPVSLSVLESKTLPKLISYIGDPNAESEFSVRGLVVGDVQSGKTSNYIGLMAKAADAGYRVIILLTGTVETLRRQTQIRVEEGFIGYDSINSEHVGVGKGRNPRIPESFTSRNNDFTGNIDKITAFKINEDSNTPMVFVIKKNGSVLRKVYNSLRKINTSESQAKITAPLLLIDDEADNASINTHKDDEEPTKINASIRKILGLFSRNTYIGYTATPFANVFISYDSDDDMLYDDLFPKDFIYSLESPSSYSGPQKYFNCDERDDDGEGQHIRYIRDSGETDEEGIMLFPLGHKKEWNGDRLFKSVYHAINVFLLANAIRDIRDYDKNSHRTMLMNMSRFTNVHFRIQRIVDDYLDRVKKALKLNCMADKESYLKNDIIMSLYDSFNREYSSVKYLDGDRSVTWEDVFKRLPDSIAKIKTVVVNSSKKAEKLDYVENEKKGLRVIAIGGIALSRGLTLEGLCVSYFYRDSSTFDVLMQMGRWFGYRQGYEDLCRIYLMRSACEYYREISDSIDELKKDIRKMAIQGKKPDEYGIRVRNNLPDMSITAANKSRNAMKKTDRKGFFGGYFETPYIYRDLDKVSHNLSATKEFIDSTISHISKDTNVSHPYYRNIEFGYILSLLKSLWVHDANQNFDVKQICNFIEAHSDIKYDVLFMGGEKGNKSFTVTDDTRDECIGRRVDIADRSKELGEQIIRINGKRGRLGGSSDTKYGLSEAELNSLKHNSKEQDYLIEGRNALLIIYYVQPETYDGQIIDIDSLSKNGYGATFGDSYMDALVADMKIKNIPYFVAYAIAFPRNEAEDNEINYYYVNRSCSYYDRIDQEDYEMYGEEED